MKFYGLFSVVGRISGQCSGISAVEAPSLPHRDYKYTKFSKKTSIAALSPPKKHPSRPQRRPPTGRSLRSTPRRKPTSGPPSLPDIRPFGSEPSGPSDPQLIESQLPRSPGRSLRSTPSPSQRSLPAAACGARPAPAPETTRPQPAEHAQPQLTKPPGRSLRSTPRRKPTSGPPPGEAAARATPKSRTPSIQRHHPTPGLRSYRSAAFPRRPTPPPLPVPQHPCTPFPATRPAARHGTTPPSDPPQPRPPAARLLFSARRTPRHTGPPAKRPAHRIPLHVTPRHDEAGAAPQSDTGPYPFRKALPAPSAAFRYRPTTASSSSTVTGSRRSPSMRHPSSVTSRSSSMRMPPKSR